MPFLSIRTTEKNAPPARRIELRPGGAEAVVGRDKACAVMIDDKKASRQHARVFSSGPQFFVEDLDSRNGTLLNGTRLQGRRPLGPGDEIRIGDHLIVFEDERAPQQPAPASAPAAAAASRRPSAALAGARHALSFTGSVESFVRFVFSVLIFGATAYASKLVFVFLLKD